MTLSKNNFQNLNVYYTERVKGDCFPHYNWHKVRVYDHFIVCKVALIFSTLRHSKSIFPSRLSMTVTEDEDIGFQVKTCNHEVVLIFAFHFNGGIYFTFKAKKKSFCYYKIKFYLWKTKAKFELAAKGKWVSAVDVVLMVRSLLPSD